MEDDKLDTRTIVAGTTLILSLVFFVMFLISGFCGFSGGLTLGFGLACALNLSISVPMMDTDLDSEPRPVVKPKPNKEERPVAEKLTHCKSCGAPLKGGTCEYCNTKWY